jgi:hypothetical protein
VVAEKATDLRRFGGWRRELRAFVELFALTGVAIVQPAFDTLRRNANDVFVPPRMSQGGMILLILSILVGPPLVGWAVEVLVGLAIPPARRWVHAGLCGAVVALIGFEVWNHQSGVSGFLGYGLVVVIGAIGALLVFRFDVARTFLRFLAIAPVVFTVLFVLSQQVSPLVVATGVDAPAPTRIGKPSRVVMVVFDELPTRSLLDGNGHIDAQLFPNFAKLAAGSTWYRNTTSVAPYTQVAVPAILSGKFPTTPNAPSTASAYPENLFTLLDHDYSINAHENTEMLNPGGGPHTPSDLGTMLGESYDLWKQWVDDNPLTSMITDVSREREQPAMRRFTRSLGDTGDRHLDYVHVLMPHYPWHLLPDGRSYTEVATVNGLLGIWAGGPELAAVGRQRHILQLQATDRALGQVIDKLEKEGAYDDALGVVAADHRGGFTAHHPLRKATKANFSEVMWVPLLVKTPHQQRGVVDDREARSIDVLPTIADHLDVHIPWKIDGRSLLGAPHPNGPRRFLEIDAPDASTAPSTAKYKEWDGRDGFRKVLASRAAAPGPDPALRIYQGFTPFGPLVGRPAAPLVQPRTGTALNGYLSDAGKFANVDPSTPSPTWAYLDGRIAGRGKRTVAITINGTIATITQSLDDNIFGGSIYAAVLPPSLFRAGNNDVQMYEVKGTPAAPVLLPIKRLA